MLPHVSNTSQIGITSHTSHQVILSPTSGGTQLSKRPTGEVHPLSAKTIRRIQASFEAINQAIRQRAEDR